MAMSSAIIVGVDTLRRAGWTTQIQRKPAVAVRADRPVFTLDSSPPPAQRGMAVETYQASGFEGFVVLPRGAAWFESVSRRGVVNTDGAAPVLKPAWALADMLATEGWGACGLWKDDIYLEDMTAQDESDWEAACVAFGLEAQPLEDQSEPSR